mmetsp:Transcript_62250/g.193172  ORF Transcript_62250/g.193172 Transcript_62250/m.193172 type:complete len:99 (+) Transcript_62250:621-917(+)
MQPQQLQPQRRQVQQPQPRQVEPQALRPFQVQEQPRHVQVQQPTWVETADEEELVAESAPDKLADPWFNRRVCKMHDSTAKKWNFAGVATILCETRWF